jgi:hypothetical protein
LIVVLLGTIVLHSLTAPQPSSAASKYEYLAVHPNLKQTNVGVNALQTELDKQGAAGWELVSAFYSDDPYLSVTLIFRRKR